MILRLVNDSMGLNLDIKHNTELCEDLRKALKLLNTPQRTNKHTIKHTCWPFLNMHKYRNAEIYMPIKDDDEKTINT